MTSMIDPRTERLIVTKDLIYPTAWVMYQNAFLVCMTDVDSHSLLTSIMRLLILPPDQPIVASFPHFNARPGKFIDKLEGLHPDPEKHTSYTILEPTLGVPLTQRATSQSNIVTRDLSRYKSDFSKFSDMVIPMFWLEYVRSIVSKNV